MTESTGQASTPVMSQDEKEANRFAICARDCEDAIRYLECALELQAKDEDEGTSQYWDAREASLIAAIISYGRAFTKSKHDGTSVSIVKVDLDSVLGGDASKLFLHELILDRRHKAAAHSAWEMRRSDRLEDSPGGGIMRRHTVVRYAEGIDLEEFKALANEMRDYFQWERHQRDLKNPRPP